MSRERGNRRNEGKSIYLRGVPFDTRKEEIERIFDRYGKIRDIYIPLDYYTKEPRGFAYIQFEDHEDAEEAMFDLGPKIKFGSDTLTLEWAKSDRKSSNEMRYREERTTGYYPPPRGYPRHSGGGGGYGSRYDDRPPPRRYDDRKERRGRHSPSPRRHRSRSPSRG